MNEVETEIVDKSRPFWPWVTGVAGVLVLAATAVWASCSTGCAGPAAEGAYTAALLDCVAQATTLAQSKACRARVRADWHVDAGQDGAP